MADIIESRSLWAWQITATNVLRCLRVLLLLLGLQGAVSVQALEVDRQFFQLGDEFDYIVDPGGQLTLEDLLLNTDVQPWRSSREAKPPSTYDPVWLRLRLDFKPELRDRGYYLYSMAENLFDIRFYRPDGRGGHTVWVTGNDYPASSREVDTPRYGFLLRPHEGERVLYMRVVGGPGSNAFPWVLMDQETYDNGRSGYISFNLVCLTAAVSLLLFNLGIAVSLRRREYAYYSLYVTSVIMAVVTAEGFGFYYLWPQAPYLNDRALHVFNLFSASMRLLTICSFLGIAALAPRLHLASKLVVSGLLITLMAVAALGVKNLPSYTATLVWGVGILMGYVVCIAAIRLKVRLAIPLLVALLLPTLGAVAQAVLLLNKSGNMLLVVQLAKVSFVAHVLLFSICLATQMRMETESKIKALHDHLTGLPGPTLLREKFEQLSHLARRNQWQMALLFLDLDGFKAINDKLGHAAGDKLLEEVSERMREELRGTDIVARLGGDEFVVLLANSSGAASPALVAERLLTAIAAPYWLSGKVVEVSASIGIAIFPYHGEGLPGLIQVADAAMYEAKENGKNGYVVAAAAPADEAQQARPLKLVAG